MTAPTYEFKIGTSVGGETLLSAFGVPVRWPRDEFVRYPEVKDLASGGVQGIGLPQANWYWDFIPSDQYAVLKVFRVDLTTGNVVIRTRDDNNEFHTFVGDLVWQPTPQWSAGRVLKLELKFVNLVQQD